MRQLLFISILNLFVISCSSTQQKQTTTVKQKFKNHQELQQTIAQRVDMMTNISAENKERLKNIFYEGIKKSASYKKQESKLVQSYVESTLNSDNKFDEIRFDKEFQKIYSLKLKNIRNTTKQVNTVLKKTNSREKALQDFMDMRDDFRIR